MTDLTTVLRDLSEKAAKATADPDITPVYPPLCSPALIQALVEVVMAGDAWRNDIYGTRGHLIRDALDRLEAVAQHLGSAAANLSAKPE